MTLTRYFRKAGSDWCCTYDIGHISQKIVRAIFDGETEGIRITGCDSRKKKVLISRGPMLVNGISTALINLLSQFDYSKYDVTVFVDKPVNAAQKEQILRMDSNKNVRVNLCGIIFTLSAIR